MLSNCMNNFMHPDKRTGSSPAQSDASAPNADKLLVSPGIDPGC